MHKHFVHSRHVLPQHLQRTNGSPMMYLRSTDTLVAQVSSRHWSSQHTVSGAASTRWHTKCVGLCNVPRERYMTGSLRDAIASMVVKHGWASGPSLLAAVQAMLTCGGDRPRLRTAPATLTVALAVDVGSACSCGQHQQSRRLRARQDLHPMHCRLRPALGRHVLSISSAANCLRMSHWDLYSVPTVISQCSTDGVFFGASRWSNDPSSRRGRRSGSGGAEVPARVEDSSPEALAKPYSTSHLKVLLSRVT
jgi:hypothetical protein